MNMQLSHWNLEHTAQQLKDPAAAAAQAGLQGEGAAAATHRDASVQPADHSSEEERIGTRKKNEEKEKEGKGRKRSFSGKREREKRDERESAEAGGLDFYA
ncbi:MAG: hypothetical protein GX843_00045 [Synergistaceae bacterium]|nr:hypothetical protein [Synergistaceae bacterium]